MAEGEAGIPSAEEGADDFTNEEEARSANTDATSAQSAAESAAAASTEAEKARLQYLAQSKVGSGLSSCSLGFGGPAMDMSEWARFVDEINHLPDVNENAANEVLNKYPTVKAVFDTIGQKALGPWRDAIEKLIAENGETPESALKQGSKTWKATFKKFGEGAGKILQQAKGLLALGGIAATGVGAYLFFHDLAKAYSGCYLINVSKGKSSQVHPEDCDCCGGTSGGDSCAKDGTCCSASCDTGDQCTCRQVNWWDAASDFVQQVTSGVTGAVTGLSGIFSWLGKHWWVVIVAVGVLIFGPLLLGLINH